MASIKWRVIGSLVLGLGLLLGFQNPANAATLALQTSRISGVRQIDTAIAVSQTGWQKADTVLLANCDHFPDALVAAPLSHQLDAPILLTPAGGIDAKVMAEIKRLGAKKIILLGGKVALHEQIEFDILNAGLSPAERIAGNDQFETARKVAERVGVKGKVILASGEQFPDALAISAYAGATETPILLTRPTKMPEATQQELDSLQQKGALHTIVVGGEAIVAKATLSSLKDVERLAGNNAYDTAAKVYEFARSILTSQTTYLVTGENFPDALAVGSLAAKQSSSIVMTQRATLPEATYAVLSKPTATPLKVVIVGGLAVVTDRIKNIVEGTVPPTGGLLGGQIIVVDPGHGTPDPGAVGPAGTQEKDGNLAIAQKLATQLRAAGAVVYLTRTGNNSPASPFTKHDDLWSRVNRANALNADLFICIHSNSWTAQSHGTETHYSSINEFDTYSESYKLAKSVQDRLVKNIGLTNRGLVNSDFTVLNHTKMPAVLVEVAFISNPTEEQLLASDSFRQKAATGIYQGVLAYKGL